MKFSYALPKLTLVLSLSAIACGSQAQQVLKIGEINSYKAQAAFLEPYKKGMDLAVEQINASGGLLGKKVVLVTRDDNANPGDAVRMAEELVSREKVDVLTGSFLSHIGLALTDYSRQKKIFFLASEPLTDKIVWDNGNKYTYRLRPSTYMHAAMLVPEAAALKKKRWAVIYPNYEFGQSAVASFKKLLKEAQPDVEFVGEQATPLGKIDAAAATQALLDAKPDAIFSALFAADVAKFVREGTTRGLFKDRPVFNLFLGEPEFLDPLKDEAPVGFYATGYPWYGIDTADHKTFLADYQKRFNDYPRAGTIIGYGAIVSLAAGIKKAGSTDSDKLAAAFSGLQVQTPFGPITYRAQDHQSTLGTYVGRIGIKDGKGVMVNYKYADGAKYQPTDAQVKQMRTNAD
jgi:branched-chain amino acid transport system substrate-binding protein